MNLVDGRRLAAEIADEVSLMVRGLEETPKLIVLTCNPNFETKKFLALKQAKAEAVGVEMRTIELPAESTTEQVLEVLRLESEKAQGIIPAKRSRSGRLKLSDASTEPTKRLPKLRTDLC